MTSQKVTGTMVSIVGASGRTPIFERASARPYMQGAQKLRSEAHLRVRRSDEVAAQRRRWTFYETIRIGIAKKGEPDWLPHKI